MKMRVLRLMEYEYDDVRTMYRDMEAWVVPATGVKTFGPSKTIRSAVIQAPFPEDEAHTNYNTGELCNCEECRDGHA